MRGQRRSFRGKTAWRRRVFVSRGVGGGVRELVLPGGGGTSTRATKKSAPFELLGGLHKLRRGPLTLWWGKAAGEKKFKKKRHVSGETEIRPSEGGGNSLSINTSVKYSPVLFSKGSHKRT